MVSYVIEQIEAGKTSTIRECYYCALNWIDEARFERSVKQSFAYSISNKLKSELIIN